MPPDIPPPVVYRTLPALSRLRSFLVFLPLIFIYTGVLGAVSLASSFFDRAGKFQHWLARFWSKLILATIRAPVTVVGEEYLVPAPARLFAANHLSSLDIPVLYANLPFSFRIIAKREVFNYVVVGWHLRRSGQIEVDSSNARASLRGLNRAADTLKRGMPVVVFPEGSRSTNGEVRPFLNGTFYVAIKAQAEIVPIALVGTLETLPMNRPHPHPPLGRGPISSAGYTLRQADPWPRRSKTPSKTLLPSRSLLPHHPLVGTLETLPMNRYHIRPHPLQLVAGAPISSAGYTLRQADALAAKVKNAIEDLYYPRAHVPDPRLAEPGGMAEVDAPSS